jgi:hypothetical protein
MVDGLGGTSRFLLTISVTAAPSGKGQLLQRHPGHHQRFIYIEGHQLALERLARLDGQHPPAGRAPGVTPPAAADVRPAA